MPFALLITLVVQNIFVAIIINAFSTIHAESKEEHWKHDLPGLVFELRKRVMLFSLHCRLRCSRSLWCCCTRHCCSGQHNTLLSSWSLDELFENPENYERAQRILNDPSVFNRHVVWSRELEFYHVLAIAARRARRQTMSGGTITSLYDYFAKAYRAQPIDAACYMSLHELCAITHPRHLDKGNFPSFFSNRLC